MRLRDKSRVGSSPTRALGRAAVPAPDSLTPNLFVRRNRQGRLRQKDVSAEQSRDDAARLPPEFSVGPLKRRAGASGTRRTGAYLPRRLLPFTAPGLPQTAPDVRSMRALKRANVRRPLSPIAEDSVLLSDGDGVEEERSERPTRHTLQKLE